MSGSISRIRALLMLLSILLPGLATAQTEPVQFMISGNIEDAVQAPLDRAQIIVYSAGTDEVLAERIFSGPDGAFAATFQANVVPNVGLDDPTLPSGPAFQGFWMGEIWPNPFVPGAGHGATLPFAAPSHVQSRPDLEMFDSRGRRIRNGETMASGIYFYRLRFDGRVTDARKLVLLGPTRIDPNLQRVERPEPKWQDGAGDTGAFRRAEGELPVDVRVIKDGYVSTTVSLQLDSRLQNQMQASLDTAPIPTAQLTIGGTLTQGAAVLYDGLGSTDPDGGSLAYSWDFGDGVRGGGQLVAHVYGQAGTYDVELTVSTTNGATATAMQQITIAVIVPPSTDATTSGTIRDAVGNLLAGVTVTDVGGVGVGVSDAAGLVQLTNLPTGVPIALECTKAGYTTQIVRLVLPASTQNSEFETTLRRQGAAVEVGAIQDGADIEGEDGVCVELPADALLKPDGTPATGKANVRLTPVDVSNALEVLAFPGSFEGVLTDGQRGLIVSYGTAEFVIEQNGEQLQLKPGSTATIEIPVYTAGAAVDDVIALWSVDETTGLWIEEGAGTVVANSNSPTGLALRADVTHFSWWNCDAFDGAPYRPLPECKIKDEGGLPTLDIPAGESCYIQGRIIGGNGPRANPFVNTDGQPTPLPLPADIDIELSASTSNGTKVGSIIVNGPAGDGGVLTIALDDPGGSPNELVLPAEFDAAIDPLGEVDTYTFEAEIGQDFSVFVSRTDGSTLEGTLRLLDPSDAEVAFVPFGSSPAVHGQVVTEAGTYTVQVDGTANEPGGYQLVARYSEVFAGSLPMTADSELTPGSQHILQVQMDAGEWFSVNYLRREPVGFGAIGNLVVKSPSGVEMWSINFGSTSINTGLLQAPETGTYLIFLQSQTIEAQYSVFVREVPQIPIGGVISGSLEERSHQYFRFSAEQDDFLRASIDKVVNFSGGVSLVNGNNSGLPGTWTYQFPDGSYPSTIPTTGEYFVLLDSGHSQVRTTRDYRVALNEILPPETLTFDAYGRAQVNGGQIGLFGDVRLYSFQAGSGDGLAVELTRGAVSTLGIGATCTTYRVGSGDWRAPQTQEYQGLGASHFGDLAFDLLQFDAFSLSEDDTYIIAVNSNTPEDGAFDLTVDRVAPSANIVVDEDLADCPGADTRSLVAAMMGAPAGSTVNVCAGTYSHLVALEFANEGASLVGSSKDEVTLRLEVAGQMLYANQPVARIAGLTFEPAVPGNSTALYIQGGNGTILEDLVIRSGVASPFLRTGIYMGSVSDNFTIRRVRIENAERCIEGYADNTLIEDNEFLTGYQILELRGDALTVQNNTWNVTAIGEAMSIDDGAGHMILNNTVNVTTPDNGAPARTFALSIEDADEFDTFPQTVIRGNQINTNEAGMYLGVDHAGSSMLVEQNTVIMIDGRGQSGIETIALRDVGSDMTVQNNVFVNTAPWRGMHFRWADRYGQLTVFNNSVSVDSSYNGQLTYPTVRLDLSPGSTATGTLPVQFMNNVLQGAGATGIEIPAGTTIDSDYNLLNGYSTYYAIGATSSGTNDLLGSDPMFVGPLLELDPSSPAVDSGTATGAPAVDHDGTARPQGGGIDRGAHEQ